MGNSALRSLAVLEETSLSQFEGDTVAIDAHHWLYTYQTALVRFMDEDVYTTSEGDEVVNLVGLLRGIPTLLDHNLTPVFVFDGSPHDRKEDEIKQRQAAKEEARNKLAEARDRGDDAAVKQYKAQSQSLTPVVHETTRRVLEDLGIPYVEAGGAGEAQAAHLAQECVVDAVLTDDYDALLFGAPETVRQYSGKGPAERMDFTATLSEHEISHRQLVDIALMCGTDYNEGIHRVGPKRALNAVQAGKTVEDVLEERDATIPGVSELRGLFLDPPVSNVTEIGDRGSPDFGAVRKYITGQWEIPDELVEDEISRFPGY